MVDHCRGLAPLNKRWLRYFGKMFLASVIVNQMASMLIEGEFLRTPPAPEAASRQLVGFVGWILLALASRAGLIFPATAVNNRMIDITTSLVAVERLPFFEYVGGFLISSLPLVVGAGFVERYSTGWEAGVPSLSTLAGSVVATGMSFAAVAANATYLSRVYQEFSPVHIRYPEVK